MPITASQGALTYIKVSEGKPWQYWIGRHPGNCTINGTIFDSNTNILYNLINKSSTSTAFPQTTEIYKIDIGSNIVAPSTQLSPNISNFNIANQASSRCFMTSIDYNSNVSSIVITGQELCRAPNLNAIETQQCYLLNSSNLTINSQVDFFGNSLSAVSSDRPTRSGTSIAVFNDGNYYIAGSTLQYFANRVYFAHPVIAKFSSNGTILSTKRILNDGNVTSNQSTSTTANITQFNNNSLILSGRVDATNTNPSRYFISSIDANLTTLNWQKTLRNSTNTVYPNVTLLTSDNSNYFYVSTSDFNIGAGIIKFDSNGNIVWQKYLGGSGSSNNLVLENLTYNNGNIYFSGANIIGKLYAANGELDFVNRLSANVGVQVVTNIAPTSNLLIFDTRVTNVGGYSTSFIYNFPLNGTIPAAGNYTIGNITLIVTNATANFQSINNSYQTDNVNISIQNDNSTNVASTNIITGSSNAITYNRVV